MTKDETFHSQGLKHLRKDPVLKVLITEYEPPIWKKTPNLFAALIRNIIGQQLSGKPATIILGRFVNLFATGKFPSPEEILALPDQKIRACGLSWAKVKYVKELSKAVVSGKLDLVKIKKLPDELVITELTKVKGIGRWTAEMILIFHLQRPDIFSLGDLGLRTAVAKLYHLDRRDTTGIEKITQRWKPYRSYACYYLWRSLENRK